MAQYKERNDIAKTRVEVLCKYTGLSIRGFGESIGMKNPQILYDVCGGKVFSLSQRVQNLIVGRYPEINVAWLRGASDVMLLKGEVIEEKDNETAVNDVSKIEARLEVIEDNLQTIRENVGSEEAATRVDARLEELENTVNDCTEKVDKLIKRINEIMEG